MLQRYLGAQLGLGRQVRFAHLLAFPYTSVPRHWDIPGLRRAMVIGSQDLKYPDDAVREAINFCGDGDGDTTPEVAERILAQLTRPLPGNGALSAAAEHEGRADQMTRDQAAILDVLKNQPRARIIGGAGTGKTWLALEQARRLARSGNGSRCSATAGAWPATSRRRPPAGSRPTAPPTWGCSTTCRYAGARTTRWIRGC